MPKNKLMAVCKAKIADTDSARWTWHSRDLWTRCDYLAVKFSRIPEISFVPHDEWFSTERKITQLVRSSIGAWKREATAALGVVITEKFFFQTLSRRLSRLSLFFGERSVKNIGIKFVTSSEFYHSITEGKNTENPSETSLLVIRRKISFVNVLLKNPRNNVLNENQQTSLSNLLMMEKSVKECNVAYVMWKAQESEKVV